MWVEKNGMFGNSERRTQQWFKMVNPPGEARDDCWQTIAVARKLFDLGHPGMKDKDGQFLFHIDRRRRARRCPIWEWAHYYDVNVDEQLFEEYRQFTRFKHKDLAPYQRVRRRRAACAGRWCEQTDGTWRETRYRFVEGDDPYVTKGKGIQFYHSVTEGRPRADLVPPVRAAARGARRRVPALALHRPRARALAHRHDDHARPAAAPRHAAGLRRDAPRGRDARSASRTASWCVLETRRGRLELPAWIDGRGQPPRGSRVRARSSTSGC